MNPSNGYESVTAEHSTIVTMNSPVKRLIAVLAVLALLAVPAMGMSSGPSHENGDGDPTVKYGCSCHNNGATSARVVVMVTGVPVMYEPGGVYDFTITVADALTLSGGDGNKKAGFLMTSESNGNFSWSDDQDIRQADGAPDDISHSEPDSDGVWHVAWTAPSEDVGPIYFWLVGNSVDGGGLPDETDYWNILSFSINPPGTVSSEESGATLDTRTISVGDYDTLFVIEETDAQREAERQEALSHSVFLQGNMFFWTSLVALIFGALLQREILGRRYDDGPEFLAMELAYPQAIWRSILSIASFLVAVNWTASDSAIYFPPKAVVEEGTNVTDLTGFLIGCAFFTSAMFAYGVYRTILAARAEQTVKDRL